MKGKTGGSRGREPPQFERDPFGLGLRQKIVPIVETPTKRRGRNNGENVAFDGTANVETPQTKPSWASKGSRTPVKDTVVLSPALVAKGPKPSPARNVFPSNEHPEANAQIATGAGPEQENGSKRKLSWEAHTGPSEGVANPSSVDPSDSGVKVRESQCNFRVQSVTHK